MAIREISSLSLRVASSPLITSLHIFVAINRRFAMSLSSSFESWRRYSFASSKVISIVYAFFLRFRSNWIFYGYIPVGPEFKMIFPGLFRYFWNLRHRIPVRPEYTRFQANYSSIPGICTALFQPNWNLTSFCSEYSGNAGILWSKIQYYRNLGILKSNEIPVLMEYFLNFCKYSSNSGIRYPPKTD